MRSRVPVLSRPDRSRPCGPWVAASLLLVTGCTASIPEQPLRDYREALATRTATAAAGSEAERRGVEAFRDFYREFSAERIREHVRDLYAPEAWFRDPFKEVSGIDAIEEYFLASASSIEESTFDIQDHAVNDGEHYFRWVMTLRLRRSPDDPPILAAGMSHVRFDTEGRVLLHVDYWDPAGTVYERFPLLGWVLERIRKQF